MGARPIPTMSGWRALSVLEEGIREACRGIPFSKITLFAGIAGGGLSGDNALVLRRFFEGFSFFAFENGSDVENLAALSDEEPKENFAKG